MIKSMTGFGRGVAGRGKNRIDVEIRTVNSRFLEIKIRGLNLEPIIENEIRGQLEKLIIRGNVQVRIESNAISDNQKLSFNQDRFELIQAVLKNIHVKYGQRINLSEIISAHDLLIIDDSNSLNKKSIISAILNAINQLNEMRLKEGAKIQIDIIDRIRKLNNFIMKINEIAKKYKHEKQNKLQLNVSELLEGAKLDESRLIQEVAYLSERVDVTEEIVRCKSHIEQLGYYLNLDDPIGKRINFLIQEILREVNTIGSKSAQIEITNIVVEMKDELEKIREQGQNIL